MTKRLRTILYVVIDYLANVDDDNNDADSNDDDNDDDSDADRDDNDVIVHDCCYGGDRCVFDT